MQDFNEIKITVSFFISLLLIESTEYGVMYGTTHRMNGLHGFADTYAHFC